MGGCVGAHKGGGTRDLSSVRKKIPNCESKRFGNAGRCPAHLFMNQLVSLSRFHDTYVLGIGIDDPVLWNAGVEVELTFLLVVASPGRW